ncbi:MFS transporter [Nonomuraea sp. NPDC050556]|uniref:MFS transporter n=1 Tax=Nonomuraea sp. NPDC050556 TaxID=3364369 RepID=UPI0037A91B98
METATFSQVFAVKEFKVLFASFALMIVGDGVKMLALSVLVYTSTGSAGLSATAYMAGWLPYIFGGMFLLSLADRLPSRALMVTGEVVRVVVCLLLAFGGLPVWAMLALVLVSGLFAPVFGAARSAMLPEVLPGDAFVLARSLMGVVSASSQVAAMAVGGTFLALTGPSGALAVTAGLSAVAAFVLRYGLPYSRARGEKRHGAVRSTLRVNGRLFTDTRVRTLLLAQWVPPMCLAGAEAMIVPYLGGTGQAGLVLASAAIGMAIGEFVVGRFVSPATRERLSLPIAVCMGAPWLAFVFMPGLGVAAVLAALAASGLSYGLGLQRRFLEAIPEDVRGQGYGLLSAGLMTGQAVGAALIGGLGELAGPHVAIAVSGAVGMIMGAVLLSRVR